VVLLSNLEECTWPDSTVQGLPQIGLDFLQG
jgi:hypothetical protein